MVGTMRNLVSEVLQSGGRQPLPQHAAGARGGQVHRDPPRGAGGRVRGDHALPQPVRGRDEGRLHPGRRVPAGAGRRAHPARDRQPGEGDVRGAAARRDVAHRDGEGEGHRRTCRRSSPSAQVGVQIKTNEAQAREAEAKGEAAYVQLTGEAEGGPPPGHRARRRPRPPRRSGLARAIGFDAQKEALGGPATAVVAVANAVADGHITVVPEVLVTGGGGGSFDGLAATLMRYLGTNGPAPGKAARTRGPAARASRRRSRPPRSRATKAKARSGPSGPTSSATSPPDVASTAGRRSAGAPRSSESAPVSVAPRREGAVVGVRGLHHPPVTVPGAELHECDSPPGRTQARRPTAMSRSTSRGSTPWSFRGRLGPVRAVHRRSGRRRRARGCATAAGSSDEHAGAAGRPPLRRPPLPRAAAPSTCRSARLSLTPRSGRLAGALGGAGLLRARGFFGRGLLRRRPLGRLLGRLARRLSSPSARRRRRRRLVRLAPVRARLASSAATRSSTLAGASRRGRRRSPRPRPCAR